MPVFIPKFMQSQTWKCKWVLALQTRPSRDLTGELMVIAKIGPDLRPASDSFFLIPRRPRPAAAKHSSHERARTQKRDERT